MTGPPPRPGELGAWPKLGSRLVAFGPLRWRRVVRAVQDVGTIRRTQRACCSAQFSRGGFPDSHPRGRVASAAQWWIAAQPQLERSANVGLEQLTELGPIHALAINDYPRPFHWQAKLILFVALRQTPGHTSPAIVRPCLASSLRYGWAMAVRASIGRRSTSGVRSPK